MNDDEDAWFAPKRYGYGAGLPIAWQGWALTAGFILLLLALSPLSKRSPAAFVAILAAATLAFLVIAARKTRGGWRWRWGRGD